MQFVDNEAMYNPAEEAIIESHGQEQELNTQRCLELQRQLLSSSPLHVTQDDHNLQHELYPQLEFGFAAEDEREEKKHNSSELSSSRDIETQPTESTSNTNIDYNTIKERDIKEMQLGVKNPTASRIWNSPKNMEDFTQKSSMSLTQEIPITAYSHLFSKEVREKPYFISVESKDSHGNAREFPNLESENASDKEIQTTVLACQVNNTCYMKLDLEPEIRENKYDDSESLDTPRAVDQLRYSYSNLQRYEPQTPHISANPFKKRGSIMQKVDLFVATQPSSVNQYHASPTSSRPSPETFDDYSSPIKRQKITDSPLDDITNRKTTVKPPTHLVTQYFSKDQQLIRTPVSEVQSFDIKLKNLVSKSGHKLRSYTTVKESQERKSRELQLPASEDSDSSQETLSRRLRDHMVYKQFPKELLQNSQVNSKSLPYKSSKNDIYSIEDRQINPGNPKFETNTTVIHGAEKEDSSLPTQPSQIGEISLEDSISANFRGTTNIISKISNKTILARDFESQDLVPLLSSDEPQLPKLNEKPNQNSIVIEKSSQTPAPKEALKNISSQMLLKKSHINSDLMETIPETSPLTHQIFSVDELSTVPFEEKRDSNINTNETIVIAKNLDSEGEIRAHSPLAHEEKVVPTTVSPLAQIPTMPKCKLPLNSPKSIESTVDATVVNSIPEVKKIRLADKNSKNHNQLLYPSIDTHISTSHKNNNHQSDFSINYQVLEENSNNYKNNDSNKLISEPQKGISGNEKSKIINESESESLLTTASRMASTTLEIQRNNTFSHTSNITQEPGSRTNSNIASLLSAPAAICEDFTSCLRNVNNSKRQSITRKSKTSSTKTLVSSASNKRNVRRKPVGVTVAVTAPSTRSSKRQSLAHTTEEDSEDPLSARMTPALQTSPRSGLFKNMVFTVSFVKNDKERNNVIQLIIENGGLLLDHGFDPLFEPISQSDPANHDCGTLSLSALGKSLSFAGVIADEHSRKTKYIQALALGLPCLSGRWIQNCISKNTILDWSAYLLCAGQSLVLGNACRSRTLQSYPAIDAEFTNTFATRKKILEGKSVLLVMGKGKTQQKRKTFNFLTRALGPTRIGHVTDITEAQKILSDDEAKGLHNWDILHVHDNDKSRGLDSLGVGRKRKFADYDGPSWPNLKRVRIITDEVMIQSLIFGELIEE